MLFTILKYLWKTVEVWLPMLMAGLSLYVAYRTRHDTKSTSKRNFINGLRNKIKEAKHKILLLEEKEYSNIEKIIFIETIQDLLLYQGYAEEKKLFLNSNIEESLFSLQLDIEDFVSIILSNTDVTTNKDQAKNLLNEFLKIL